MEVPDELDLAAVRGLGMQPGEEALPEHSTPPPAPVFDEALVSQLLEMGFPRPACEKALYFTNNASMEAATNWIMEHIGDADLSDPFVPPGHAPAAGAAPGTSSPHGLWACRPSPPSLPALTADFPLIAGKDGFVANEESVAQLMNLGFSQAHAVKALKATDNALDRAADWVFSHPEELDDDMASGSGQAAEPEFRDGSTSEYLSVAKALALALLLLLSHALWLVTDFDVALLFSTFSFGFRVPLGGLHLAHGYLDHGGTLRVPHPPRRPVGHLQRQQGGRVRKPTQRTGLPVPLRESQVKLIVMFQLTYVLLYSLCI